MEERTEQPSTAQANSNQSLLRREVGFWGAILLGLGSMIGTGVFVSIGIGAGVTGPSVLIAVILGAGVAICNGLSSAQLAASHPVSGGTYEYGYQYLTPWLGFVAGWMFLLAKSASAATAALGFAGYVLAALAVDVAWLRIPLALAAVVGLTVIVLKGIRRSNVVNTLIVGVTLAVLLFFIWQGLGSYASGSGSDLNPFWRTAGSENQGWFADAVQGLRNLLYASALMFVAYTGYGRIATLGEEVKNPQTTIPKAIIATMIITMLLYLGVTFTAIVTVGSDRLARATLEAVAPLEIAARTFDIDWAPFLIVVGAITAMLGVLLNLLLGLSRVLLAMGRRGDMPSSVARLDASGSTPTVAVVVVAGVIGLLVLIGNVETTWSFSAFTVLIYYALTNLSALQLSGDKRLYPRWISWTGLAACTLLAFLVEWQIWLIGLGLIGLGLVWHLTVKFFSRDDSIL